MNEPEEQIPQLPTAANIVLRGNSRSSSIGSLAGALAKAQGAVKNPLRERKVKIKTKQGYEYSFFYADLAACLEVARPVLSANGLAIVQTCSVQSRDAVVVTELMHTSGEWIRSELAFRGSDDIKELAGIFTYLRRYAISPIIGIAPEDDDQVEQSQSGQPEPAKGKDPKYQNISVSEPKPADPPKRGNGASQTASPTPSPATTGEKAAPAAAPVESTEHDKLVDKAKAVFGGKVVEDTRKKVAGDDAPLAAEAKDDLWDLVVQLWPSDGKHCLNTALKERKLKPVDFKTLTVGQAREVHALVSELLGVDGSEAPF